MNQGLDDQSKEARKAALALAKEKLNKRKNEATQLKKLREQRDKGLGQDFGKKVIEETKIMMENLSKQPEPVAQKGLNHPGVPGRRMDLSIVANLNNISVAKKEQEKYYKEVQTDCEEIANDAEIFTNEMKEEDMDKILLSFASNEVKAWPPKAKKNNAAQNNEEIKQDELDKSALISPEDDLKDNEDDNNNNNNNNKQLKVLSEEELNKMVSNIEFQKSFKLKSLFMERALGINEHHRIFYEEDADKAKKGANDEEQGEKLSLINKYEIKMNNNNNTTSTRSITSIDFSRHNSDWFLASYGELSESTNISESDGLVYIWNIINSNNHPEHILEAQSMVTNALFHPTNPTLIFGSTISGQILAWDIRVKRTPVYRTLFAMGHSSPVFAMDFLPSMNSKIQHILTISNDAKLCIWNDDFLAKPTNEINLKLKDDQHSTARVDELSTTCFSFSLKDSNQIILGSDEGCIYKATDIYTRIERDVPLISEKISEAHYGPITNIAYHPYYMGMHNNHKVGTNTSQLYLTSSYDWTVKLWHNKYNNAPISVFEQMNDYIYDVAWSPVSSSVFACCDGSGKINIFNLNLDFESPVGEPTQVTKNNSALTKIKFTSDGKHIVVGDSDGVVYYYDVHSSLYETNENDVDQFEDNIKRALKNVA